MSFLNKSSKCVGIALCFGIFLNLQRCAIARTHSEAKEIINSAIVKNFINEYGEMGTISPEKFKSFVERTLVYDGHSDHLATEDIGDVHILKIIKACSDATNLTGCQEFLYEHCIDSNTVLDLFSEEIVDNNTLADVFPALVFHIQSNVCRKGYDVHSSALKADGKPPSSLVWGYGIGCVVFLCIISNIGGCLGPFMKKKFFQRMLMFCVALAAATLGCTGLMVLLPESMGLTGKDSPIPDYNQKAATAVGGIYFFYLSERFMKLYMKKGKKKPKKNSKDGTELMDVAFSEQLIEPNETMDKIKSDIDTIVEIKGDKKKRGPKKKVATVAWMILIGDALHNFVDGMSIGAGFTDSIRTGVSVALAVSCEEFPHELGDIAILLHSGMSMKKALFYNFLAALSCGGGLVVGILLGENTSAATWIFAVAAGMFIYISLVDMVPEMDGQAKIVIENEIETPLMTLFIQNVGLITGFVIILMLTIYGGDIEV